MKTPRQILKDLIADFISSQDEVTYVGKASIIRALFNAMSYVVYELWNDIIQLRRSVFPQLAMSTDLDNIAERYGITRRGATKSSVLLLFNGTAGTVIPAGTKVKSYLTGTEYETLSDLTLGNKNPDIVRPINSNYLGDVVFAESITTGQSTKVLAKELTVLSNTISGVDSVTNIIPSEGGEDVETDEQLRQRILDYVNILAQGTKDFYQALAVNSNSSVLKSNVIYNSKNLGLDIYLLKNTGGIFTGNELDSIASDIYSNQRAMNKITCYNPIFKGIEINLTYKRDSNYTAEIMFRNIAEAIAGVINIYTNDFGSTVKYWDILQAVANVEGVLSIDTTKFFVNNGTKDISCSNNEFPKFSGLTANDTLTTITKAID